MSLGGMGGRTTSITVEGNGFRTLASDNNKFKESDRKSTKVRVQNEDDPDQFVEFCRADKITLTPKKTKTPPPRTSSYDTSGGYHNVTPKAPNSIPQKNREYEFQYPTDKQCVQKPSQPKKGPR